MQSLLSFIIISDDSHIVALIINTVLLDLLKIIGQTHGENKI